MRLWADFNNVMDDDTVATVLRGFVAAGEPYVGQVVSLYDHEGNYCEGFVDDVDGTVVRVRLIDQTWFDADSAVDAPRQLVFSAGWSLIPTVGVIRG